MDTTRTRRQGSRAAPCARPGPAGVNAGWRAGRACVIAVAGLLALAPAARAQAVSEESRIKAAMVYNLARAVVWPAEFERQEQFIIAVAGSDSMTTGLTTIAGKHVNGKPVVVRDGNPADADRPCQILYVSRSTPEAARNLARVMAKPGVLTVSDVNGFCERAASWNCVRTAVESGC